MLSSAPGRLSTWTASSMAGSSMLTWDWPETPALILATVLLALVARSLLNRAITRVVSASTKRAVQREDDAGPAASRVLARAAGLASERRAQRSATVGSLLRSVTTFAVAVVAVLMVMSLVGLPLAPVLTSAGIGGIALGFGAQSLVKDFLSGIFMIVEDQYGVGDVVDTGEATGTVEEVGLRITRLRDPSGVVWYVRNGEILRVANKSQGWSTAIVDIPVAYDEDADQVVGVLRETLAPMSQDEDWAKLLLEPPNVVGVESIAAGAMTVRVTARCAPNEQWGVQRAILERGKRALDRAGVRGPAPRYDVSEPPGPHAGRGTGPART